MSFRLFFSKFYNFYKICDKKLWKKMRFQMFFKKIKKN